MQKSQTRGIRRIYRTFTCFDAHVALVNGPVRGSYGDANALNRLYWQGRLKDSFKRGYGRLSFRPRLPK
jgi:hypothetical protein